MAAALLDAYRGTRGLKLVPGDRDGRLYRRHVAHALLGFAELARRYRLAAPVERHRRAQPRQPDGH